MEQGNYVGIVGVSKQRKNEAMPMAKTLEGSFEA